jgi:hypothetical protein
MKYLFIVAACLYLVFSCTNQTRIITHTMFCSHNVVLDGEGKIIPWYTPSDKAYDHFLRLRWDFIKHHVPNAPGPDPRSRYPLYYFYSAFVSRNDSILPDNWMNDIGEKIPNWFENARLYYAYSGDSGVISIIRDFVDYTLEHGTSSPDFAWPSFPYTTANSGDTLFRGFSNHPNLVLHEIQVDHAGEMGNTYFRMYLLTGEVKYLKEAIRIADVLAKYAKDGNAEESVWPYRVVMSTGVVTASYGANWTGCYMLLENLSRKGLGNVEAYTKACDKVRKFIQEYPMKNGYWTDGHSDTDIKSNTYKSNLSASNMTLCMFDYPELDPAWKSDIPKLISWTEDNFVNRTAPGEPATMWGANIVGEQDTFNIKMDYQTARYAAECARWYAVSGDDAYREKACRSLTWVTYCNDSAGMAFESPVSKGILSWWSDCYGECPRMFYHAFAGMPELAPQGEDHILYSEGILKDVYYGKEIVSYISTVENGTEYLKLLFKPVRIFIDGEELTEKKDRASEGYVLRKLKKGEYSVIISHNYAGKVEIRG